MIFKVVFLMLLLVTTCVHTSELTKRVLFTPKNIDVTPRIIRGEATEFNEFRFYARLLMTDYESFYSHLCGATLLSDQYVLTAAHCVDMGMDMDNLAIVVDNIYFSNVNQFELKSIDSIYIHPDYNPDGSVNDIAIIKLSSKLTENVEFISIPTDDDKLYYEQLATMSVTGLGFTDNNSTLSNRLLTTEVTLLSDSECSSLVEFYFAQNFIANNALCVIPSYGNGACNGDSGGPLTYIDGDGIKRQAGLVSYGAATCALQDVPNVYTELHGYKEWIADTMNAISTNKTLTNSNSETPKKSKSGGGGSTDGLLIVLFYVAIYRFKCRLASLK